MSANPDLLSLPEEVVHYICDFLKLQDLLSLSATCHGLRSALNYNSVWRKYGGDAMGQALKEVNSRVKPTFTEPQYETSTLEPLCEQKAHLFKLNHLFNNYRKGKFVKHSVPFGEYISDCKLNMCWDLQITYKDQYLFTHGFCINRVFPVVNVYNIEEAPYLLSSFKLVNHAAEDPNYGVKVSLKVHENKLIVNQDHFFDVHEIKLPDLEFPVLHSIDVKIHPKFDFHSLFLAGDFIILGDRVGSDKIHVWRVSTGARLDDIKPKIEGSRLKICSNPSDDLEILFRVEVNEGESPNITPHLYVYSLRTLKFTNFHAVLPLRITRISMGPLLGLMDSQHVVIIYGRPDWKHDIFVYDKKSSALLFRMSEEFIDQSESLLVNGYLVLSKNSTLVVVSLRNSENKWEIELEAPCIPYGSGLSRHNINMLTLQHFILVKTSASIEVWNVESWRKCFVLPRSIRFCTLSDFCSKLVAVNGLYLETLMFW